MADSKIQLTSLDFDTIKGNLKNYLKSQSEFVDFDFEGSALNILLDVLAYNTFYNSFYLNMAANEMFLDTAVMRPSVVSHAKLLGYTPRSAVASQAFANVTITRTDSTTILNIPAYTQFAAKAPDGSSYSFYTTTDSEYISNSGDNFNFVNLLLKEGLPVNKSYSYSEATNPNQYFDLTDSNIDTSTLRVLVQNSISNPAYTVFTLAEDATEVSTTSAVYYLEETQTGSHRIYFGDGIIGKKLQDGNVVVLTYLKTNAEVANGCRTFTLQSTVLAGSTSTVTVSSPSNGGSQPESISQIKFTAPKSFIAQNRAVTKNDYVSLIEKKYPYFDSVTVWGGDEETPPVYGKIFISAKPKEGFIVTDAQQQYLIKSVLKPISVLTVTPEFVDADYNYLNFSINVNYDPKQTLLSSSQLSSAIRTAVINYNNLNLNTFNAIFQYSKFIRYIDNVDQSIQSVDTTIYLQKKFSPDLTKAATYILKYGVPLNRGTISDRLYSSPHFLMTDQSGIQQQCFIEEVPYSFGGLEGVTIENAGGGYSGTPTVTIDGDGIGATANAIIVNGKINSVEITNPGSDYTVAAISVTGGGGKGAVLSPILTGSKGAIRIYYYNNNKVKRILNTNAGTIYYSNGTVTIENFKPDDVASSMQVLSVYIKPDAATLESNKNIIFTQDNNDSTSIVVNAIPSTR